MDEIFLNFFR